MRGEWPPDFFKSVDRPGCQGHKKIKIIFEVGLLAAVSRLIGVGKIGGQDGSRGLYRRETGFSTRFRGIASELFQRGQACSWYGRRRFARTRPSTNPDSGCGDALQPFPQKQILATAEDFHGVQIAFQLRGKVLSSTVGIGFWRVAVLQGAPRACL